MISWQAMNGKSFVTYCFWALGRSFLSPLTSSATH